MKHPFKRIVITKTNVYKGDSPYEITIDNQKTQDPAAIAAIRGYNEIIQFLDDHWCKN